MTLHEPDKRGVTLRALRVAGATLATGTTFVIALVGGLLLQLDLPVTRRVVSRVTNEILHPVFQGRLIIDSLGRLGLDGIDGTRVHVTDPSGKAVLSAEGVHGRIATWTLVRALLGSPTAIEIHISEASIDQADLGFDTDESGALHIASAFTPRPTPPSIPPSPPTPVHVVIEHAHIRHVWVHGQPRWGPLVDSELDDVDAKVVIQSSSVRIDVRNATLAARSLPFGASGGGMVHGQVLVPSEHGHPVGVTGSFRGAIGGVEENARFSMDGDEISADLDLRDVAPEKVRALVVDYPLQDVLSAHIAAHGTLPTLDVEARAHFRRGGSVLVTGQAILSENKTATIHAKVAAIDLRGIAPGLPSSSLGASMEATIALDSQATLTGETTIDFEGGTVGREILPPAKVHATFAHAARFGNRVDATVEATDPGIHASANLHLVPRGASSVLTFQAKAEAPRLDAMGRLRLPLEGSAVVTTRGTLALDSFLLSADLTADVTGLHEDTLDVKTVHATAHVGGSIFLPQIDATLHADSLDLNGVHADEANLTTKGVLGAQHVHLTLDGGDVPDIDADVDVRIGASTLLHDAKVGITRGTERIEIHAADVKIAPDAVHADDVSVLGLGGAIRAQLRMAPHVLEVQGEGHDIDLARAARIAGTERYCKSGHLSFDLDAKIKDKRAEGKLTLDLADASIANVKGATAHAEVKLGDRHLSGHAHAQLGELGTLDVDAAELTMGAGEAASLRSWQRVYGAIELNAHLDLARVAATFPEDSLPFGEARGILDVSGRYRRVDRDTPYLQISAKTTGLVLNGKSAKTVAVGAENVHSPPPWRVEGIDFGIDGRVDGETGFAEVAARIMDATGPLVALDAKSTALPYSVLFAGGTGTKEVLEGVRFDAHVAVPKRNLTTFPAVLKLGGTDGDLEADATWHGTFADPEVELRARLGQAHSTSVRLSLPVDLELASHYAHAHAEATIKATGKRGPVMNAEARFDGNASEILRGVAGALWEASFHAHMDTFPLSAIGALEDRQVHGHVTGDVTLNGLHKDAKATLELTTKDMQVGEVTFRDARVHGDLDGHALDLTARLDHGDGSADAHAHMGATWGAAIVPHLDAPADFTFLAKRLRAETLLPFAREALAELEGRIDANAHLSLPATGNAQMDGKVVFDQGKFELSSALGEFHDVSATLSLTPDGVARLENAKASGVTGLVQASASGRFDGLALASARARIEIPGREPLPLTIEGTPLGTIDGSFDIAEDVTADHKGVDVKIDVPRLHVQLPESGSRSVQVLGPLDSANVGVRRTATDFDLVGKDPDEGNTKPRPENALRMAITTKLGNDVELRRGKDLKIGLEGEPSVSISDKVQVAGQIRLKAGGTLDVEGKTFEIEKGTVTFVGDDSTNPQIVVTASWSAPDGTQVFADYIGPLKSGKVTLRSEPPLPHSDIASLLLYGSAEGQSGAQAAGGDNGGEQAGFQAAGVAGGAATQPINHALDQLGLHAVSARVDTSTASSPKPEVEVQIARDISVQLAVVVGTPPPGSNPDTTLVTLNWHFLKLWSLATTVGDRGSSILDVVWQRRY